MGSDLIDNPPKNRMIVEITIANTGRRRNHENMILSPPGWLYYFSTEKRSLFRMEF